MQHFCNFISFPISKTLFRAKKWRFGNNKNNKNAAIAKMIAALPTSKILSISFKWLHLGVHLPTLLLWSIIIHFWTTLNARFVKSLSPISHPCPGTKWCANSTITPSPNCTANYAWKLSRKDGCYKSIWQNPQNVSLLPIKNGENGFFFGGGN